MTWLNRDLPLMETLQLCEDASSTAGNVMLRVFCEAVAESTHDCRVEHDDAWAAAAKSRHAKTRHKHRGMLCRFQILQQQAVLQKLPESCRKLSSHVYGNANHNT